MRDARLLLAALLHPGIVAAADWCSTGAGDFSFETRFEGEKLPGEFRDFDVTFRFDPNRPEDAELEVTVNLKAADMGDPEMNAVLFAPEWFDTERFGQAVFTSTRVEPEGDDGYAAKGTLQLKGKRGAVTVPFSWQGGGGQARMQGVFELRRTRFDVGTGEWADDDAIGLDVKLAFDIELEHCD
ncbi:MAG: YceI family protein [Woeseiaceae bacterium]|nr:YceI family protein [Woeseiaceae bacterium]